MTDTLYKVILAAGMLGLLIVIHALGLVLILRTVVYRPQLLRPVPRYWSMVWLLIRIPATLSLIHLLEIGMWALFFWWQHCFADAGSSLYFAGSSYVTVGYGDLVLPAEWRLFGPLVALTGLLTSGLSVGFFIAVVGTVYQPAILHDRATRTFGGSNPGATGGQSLGIHVANNLLVGSEKTTGSQFMVGKQ